MSLPFCSHKHSWMFLWTSIGIVSAPDVVLHLHLVGASTSWPVCHTVHTFSGCLVKMSWKDVQSRQQQCRRYLWEALDWNCTVENWIICRLCVTVLYCDKLVSTSLIIQNVYICHWVLWLQDIHRDCVDVILSVYVPVLIYRVWSTAQC